MSTVADSFKRWRPAREVLKIIRSVRTRFPQIDRATRVGGWPLERFATIHGPSNHGKTIFTLGLGLSFLEAGHFFAYIDAERTTPITWLEDLLKGYADHPGFVALRPDTYEEAVDAVRELHTEIANARERGELPPGTGCLTVVDSLRKLVPKNILAKVIAGTDKGGIDGVSGRAAQLKAALNASWLDELTALLDNTGTSLAAIARESQSNDPKSMEEYNVGGGTSVIYDAGLVIRVVRAAFIHEKQSGEEIYKSPVYGERHRVEIRKTKIAYKEDRVPRAYFHTSNGAFTPAGFDRARDLHEMAVDYGIVKQAGSWYSWNKQRWQGTHQGVKRLTENVGLLGELEAEVRERFSPDEELPSIEDVDLSKDTTPEQD